MNDFFHKITNGVFKTSSEEELFRNSTENKIATLNENNANNNSNTNATNRSKINLNDELNSYGDISSNNYNNEISLSCNITGKNGNCLTNTVDKNSPVKHTSYYEFSSSSYSDPNQVGNLGATTTNPEYYTNGVTPTCGIDEKVDVIEKIDLPDNTKIKKSDIRLEANLMNCEDIYDLKESYFKTEENRYSKYN